MKKDAVVIISLRTMRSFDELLAFIFHFLSTVFCDLFSFAFNTQEPKSLGVVSAASK